MKKTDKKTLEIKNQPERGYKIFRVFFDKVLQNGETDKELFKIWKNSSGVQRLYYSNTLVHKINDFRSACLKVDIILVLCDENYECDMSEQELVNKALEDYRKQAII